MSKRDIKEQLKAALLEEMAEAVGLQSGVLSAERTTLKADYLGQQLRGDEDRRKIGLSTYVDRTVLETVEWAKPALLKVFCSGDDIVTFEPKREQDNQHAKDATQYINAIAFGRDSFATLYEVISDSLLQRTGWAKVYYDDDVRTVYDERNGLTFEEAQSLAIVAEAQSGGTAEVKKYKDNGVDKYCLRLQYEENTGIVRVESLAPEQVIYNNGAKDVECCRFIAHWEYRTIAEMMQQGYAYEDLCVGMDPDEYDESQINNAMSADDYNRNFSLRDDKMREIAVYEAYVMGLDDKDNPIRYKVLYVGDQSNITVLEYEPWTMSRPPLFPLSSVPIAHSLSGLCLADLVSDIQRLRTELYRQGLDGLALGNFGEFVINSQPGSAVDLDQLLSRRVGGVYQTEGNVTITPLPVDPQSAQNAFNALTYTDQIKESRSGIGQQLQGASTDAMMGTATGASIVYELANQRLDLIARIITEWWAKPLCKYCLELVVKYQNRPVQIKIQGRFVTFNPSRWTADMHVRTNVGLGIASRQQVMTGIQSVIANQMQVIDKLGVRSPIRLDNLISAFHAQARSLGFENPEEFYGSKETARKTDELITKEETGKEDQESPEAQLIRSEAMKNQAEIQQMQIKAQLDLEKMQVEFEMKERMAVAEHQRKMAEIAEQMRLLQLKATLDAQLKSEKQQLDAVEKIYGQERASAEGNGHSEQPNI